jgi:endonuclease/exonuclease/phosphatase family metal-dependent hydrolase
MKCPGRLLLLALSLWLVAQAVNAQTRSLRILTINVWTGLDYRGFFTFGEYESAERRELRFKLLLTQIRTLDPDIVFLQEANPVAGFTARLADSIGFDEIHHVCNGGIKPIFYGIPFNFKEGIAIVARPSLSLEQFDVWKLSGSFGLYGDPITIHFDESIFSLVGKITVDSVPIYIVGVHLHAGVPADSVLAERFQILVGNGKITEEEYRQALKQWREDIERKKLETNRLLDRIKELPAQSPVIVAGDFNAAPDEPCLLQFKNSGALIDTYPLGKSVREYTWDPKGNENVGFSTQITDVRGDALDGPGRLSALYDTQPRRIDHIFLSQHFKPTDVSECRIVLDSVINGVHASDHYGVLTEVDLANVLQESPKELKTVAPLAESTIEPLPILTYDTDVGLGYGAKVFVLNHLRLNESFDIVVFNSTRGERWYRFVFSVPDFELRQAKTYPLALDFVVDYDKWISNSFFGVGNGSSFDDKEFYTKEPLEISLTLSRGFSTRVVGQLGARYKTVRNFNFEGNSRLMKLQPELNSSKATFASLFAGFRYDTRNSFINPSRGLVLQGEAEFAPSSGLSNVAFTRLAAWIQNYSVLFYPKTVLAIRLGMQGLIGNNLPVQVLLPIGGNNTLRGSPQDRYLDKIAALVNAELRFPILWRFGGVLGLDAGKVWNSLGSVDLTCWAVNPTGGLRFYMDTFVVRLDIGFGSETTGLYFNFGHIF